MQPNFPQKQDAPEPDTNDAAQDPLQVTPQSNSENVSNDALETDSTQSYDTGVDGTTTETTQEPVSGFEADQTPPEATLESSSSQDTSGTDPVSYETSTTETTPAFDANPTEEVTTEPTISATEPAAQTPAPADDLSVVSPTENTDALSPAPSSYDVTPPQSNDVTTNSPAVTSNPGVVASTPDTSDQSSVPASGVFGSAIPLGAEAAAAGQVAAGKGRFSKKVIGIIAAVAAVVLTGGGALAYFAVMNTPEMILRDTFFNTTKQTEGSFDAVFESEAGGEKFKISANGAYQKDAIRSNFTLEADALPTKRLVIHQYAVEKKFYLKVDDLRKHFDSIAAEIGPEYSKYLTPYEALVNKVDSKWIVVTEEDLEKYFGIKPQKDNEASVCVQKALTDYQSDKKQQKEVFKVYEANKFITAKKQKDEKVADRSAYHFLITLDQKKAESFAKALESTVIYKAVTKCVPKSEYPIAGAKESKDNEPMPDIELWVDKKSRTLRKVQIKPTAEQEKKDDIKGVASVTFDFFSPVKMSEPKADVTIGELKSDIDKMYGEVMQNTTDQVNLLGADSHRKTDINAISGQLESFYADNKGYYPGMAALNDAATRSKLGVRLDPEAFADPSNANNPLLVAGKTPVPTAHTTEPFRYYFVSSGCSGSGLDQRCKDYILYTFLEASEPSVYSRSSAGVDYDVLGARTEQSPLVTAVKDLLSF